MIFRDATAHNLTTTGHVWIVTEQALSANNTPVGTLGLELNYANDEKEHIRVSNKGVKYFTKVLRMKISATMKFSALNT